MEPLVVYIIADNRSGSTLLDYLLSCHPDAISVGELHHLHGHYFKEGIGKSWNWECSCGDPVSDCVFWTRILKSINFSGSFITKMSTSKINLNFISRVKIKRLLRGKACDEEGKKIAQNRWEIYNAVFKQTGKRLIVDSSKDAIEAYYLSKYSEGNIKFLLLERNIWEVALSKKKRKERMPDDIREFYNKRTYSIYKEIFLSYKILRKNRMFERIIQDGDKNRNIKRILYLDLAANPQKTIQEICMFIGIEIFAPPLKTNQYKGVPHVLGGSPSRYDERVICPDSRWKLYYKNRPAALLFGQCLQLIK